MLNKDLLKQVTELEKEQAEKELKKLKCREDKQYYLINVPTIIHITDDGFIGSMLSNGILQNEYNKEISQRKLNEFLNLNNK